ncbi:hypothetical protein AB4Y43_06965 [Paraburkholderia sp. BR10872]|uniref:hypothetical protein n=1 Tax=Paraburkholderia sp. BR10872 TaxID=3236989 RepID=UPI0034D3730F
MADIAVWPDTLPQPRADGYGVQPKAVYAATDMDSGRSRTRRRFTQTPSTISVKWRFTWTQFAVFEAFLKYEINLGAAPFSVGLLNGMGVTAVQAQFFEDPPYQSSISDSRTWFDVTANLKVKSMPVLGYDYYVVLRKYSEQEVFGAGDRLHRLIHSDLTGPLRW